MRTTAALTSLVFVLVLCCSAALQAAPLVPAHVPAEAKWVCHLNLQAVRACEMVQACREKWQGKKEYQEKIGKMIEKMGADPTEDLVGVTVYDTKYERHHGVVLMHLTAGHQEKIAAAFKKQHPDHKTSEYAGRVLSTWTEHCKWRGEHQVTGCFANDKTIVLSRDPARVKAALDTIDGKQESLAKDSPLLKGLPRKALLASRAIDVDAEYQQKTRCPVLKNSASASFSLSHKGDGPAAKWVLETESEEAAQSYADIVQGFKAMVQLRHGKDESAAKVLAGLKTKVKGTTITVSWQATHDDITAAVKKGMQRRAEVRERWKKMKEAHQHKHEHKGEKSSKK